MSDSSSVCRRGTRGPCVAMSRYGQPSPVGAEIAAQTSQIATHLRRGLGSIEDCMGQQQTADRKTAGSAVMALWAVDRGVCEGVRRCVSRAKNLEMRACAVRCGHRYFSARR